MNITLIEVIFPAGVLASRLETDYARVVDGGVNVRAKNGSRDR